MPVEIVRKCWHISAPYYYHLVLDALLLHLIVQVLLQLENVMVNPLAVKRGERKWKAFVLLTLVLVVFVLSGAIKNETIIRDLILGLMGAFGLANVGEHFAGRYIKAKPADRPDELKSIAE